MKIDVCMYVSGITFLLGVTFLPLEVKRIDEGILGTLSASDSKLHLCTYLCEQLILL